MWWKWLEHDDNRFLYEARHKKDLEREIRGRTLYVPLLVFLFVIAVVEIATQGSSVALGCLCLMVTVYLYFDLRIKILKLIYSKRQESSDSNTPEKDQTS
jgi:hypothetical protein